MTNEQRKILYEMNYPLYLLLEESKETREEVHSDDEVDHSQIDNDEDSQEESQEQEEPEEPEVSEEDIFNFELQAAEDKVVQFILYEKLLELDNKLDILQSNIQLKNDKFDLEFTERIDQYKQYVRVLNELIFSMSTNTIYNIVGQLELELIGLLEQYVIEHNNTVTDEDDKIKGLDK